MTTHFRSRGYPHHIIFQARSRAKHTDRSSLLTPKTPKTDDHLLFTHAFNPRGPDVKSILDQQRSILEQHPQTKPLGQKGIRVVLKRNPNLRDMLIKADLNPPTSVRGSHPCNKPCSTCKFMTSAIKFTSTATQKEYRIRLAANCSSHNVIYRIQCTKCSKQYIGQTSNTIHTRLLQHLGTIRNRIDTPIANHFNQDDHVAAHVTTLVIDRPQRREHNTRLRHKSAWIHELITMAPSGINIQE